MGALWGAVKVIAKVETGLVRVEIFRCLFIRIWGGPLRGPACQSRKRCLWGTASDHAGGVETEGWNGILTPHNLTGRVKKLNPDAAMGFHLILFIFRSLYT